MTAISVPFFPHHGPIVPVTIGPPVIPEDNIPVGSYQPSQERLAFAMINTGNYPTFVTETILDAIAYPIQEKLPVRTPFGAVECDFYMVWLSIGDYNKLTLVAKADLAEYGCDCLIGRDVLWSFQFTYNGPQKVIGNLEVPKSTEE